jgi:hypothetical protein
MSSGAAVVLSRFTIVLPKLNTAEWSSSKATGRPKTSW